MSIIREGMDFIAVCDGCGNELPARFTYGGAQNEITRAGWTRKKTDDGWQNFCPKCTEERSETT